MLTTKIRGLGAYFGTRYGGLPGEKYIDVLDGVRALMIFIVGAFHIWQQSWLTPWTLINGRYYSLDPLLRSGYIWVDGMILLSGFLLYLPFTRRAWRKGDGRRFFLRRFARIYPSYALNVLVFFLLRRGEYAAAGDAAVDLMAHLTFTHTFTEATYYGSPINGALWTVGVEVWFYLLFPLICRLYQRHKGLTFAGMLAAAFAFRLWSSGLQDTRMTFNQLPAFLDVYALGFAGAEAYTVLRERLAGQGSRAKGFFAVVLLVSLLYMGTLIVTQAARNGQEQIRIGQMETRFPLALALTAAMVSAAFTFSGVRFLLGNRVMAFLSAISFQFYMYHQALAVIIRENRWIPSVSATPNVDGEWPWQPVFTAVCFLGVALLSAALTYGFEKPIAGWILGRTRRDPPGENGEASAASSPSSGEGDGPRNP